jgi:hypothetical protein
LDKDHSTAGKPIHNTAVVNDLVKDIDGRAVLREGSFYGLNSHLNSSAKTSGLSQYYLLDLHRSRPRLIEVWMIRIGLSS